MWTPSVGGDWIQLGVIGGCIVVGSYLLGSINFSIILSKIFMKQDIRQMGSGNAGATNMLRSVGKKAAALTFLLDAAKCAAAVLPARFICLNQFRVVVVGGPSPTIQIVAQWGAYLAGFCCMMGHIFPIYFKFRGGKGVVTLATTAALVDWRVFLATLGVFIIVLAISRMVSLSSILGAVAYPIATFFITFFADRPHLWSTLGGQVRNHDGNLYVIVSTAITLIGAAVIILKHHSNIKRILNGTEKKISFKKDKTSV